jgi:hypothetical protein
LASVAELHKLLWCNAFLPNRSPGFTAELDRYADDDVTVIVLSNSYATASQDPIADSIAAIVFGQSRSDPEMRAVTAPQSILESYSGEYQYEPDYFVPNAKFAVTAADGYLLLELGEFSNAARATVENGVSRPQLP